MTPNRARQARAMYDGGQQRSEPGHRLSAAPFPVVSAGTTTRLFGGTRSRAATDVDRSCPGCPDRTAWRPRQPPGLLSPDLLGGPGRGCLHGPVLLGAHPPVATLPTSPTTIAATPSQNAHRTSRGGPGRPGNDLRGAGDGPCPVPGLGGPSGCALVLT